MTWTAIQAALTTPSGPVGRGSSQTSVLQDADGVLDLDVAAMVGLKVQGLALSIGDEGVEICTWRTAVSIGAEVEELQRFPA